MSESTKGLQSKASESKASKKDVISWGTAYAIASVTFGIHIGGGFATGNQTVQFYVSHGWTAVFLPILAMVFLNIIIRSMYLTTQINGCRDYREFGNAAYAPIQIFFCNLYELGCLLLQIVATATAIAGSDSLLVNVLNMPHALGIIITSALFFFLVIFGKDLVSRAATFMGVFMIVGVLVLCLAGLTLKAPDETVSLARNASPSNQNGNLWRAVWDMFRYVGFQAFALGSIMPYAQQIKNKAGVNRTVFINFILNGTLITLTNLTLLRWMPHFYDSAALKITNTLPIIYIADQTGNPVLRVIYYTTLYFAFISTGVGCIFGAVTRFETKLFAGQEQKVHITVRRGIIALIMVIFSYLLSRAGLTLVVKYGYGNLGWFGAIMILLPALTFWWYRTAKRIKTVKGTGYRIEE